MSFPLDVLAMRRVGRYVLGIRFTVFIWVIGFEIMPDGIVVCIGPVQVCVSRLTVSEILDAVGHGDNP